MAATFSVGDFSKVYKFILDYCRDNTPTLLVFEPDKDIFDEHLFCWISADDTKRNILAIEHNSFDTMISSIKEAFEAGPDVISIPMLDNLIVPSARIGQYYKSAIDICNLLQIPCPQIFVMRKELFHHHFPESKAIHNEDFDDKNNLIAEYICFTEAGQKSNIYSLAHELRHCWQSRQDSYYQSYSQLEASNYIEFNLQPEEIDAEAFALYYMEDVLGYVDATQLMYPNPEAESEWAWYTKIVRNRKAEIIQEIKNTGIHH